MREIGAVLIGIAFALPGFLMAAENDRRRRKGLCMMRFWEYVLFEIKTFTRDQKTIFHGYRDAYLEKTGFLPLLRQNTDTEPVGALARTLSVHMQQDARSPIKEETLKVGERFGMQSKSAQTQDLEALLSLYRREVEEKQKENAAKSRLYLICGAALGLGVWILLV